MFSESDMESIGALFKYLDIVTFYCGMKPRFKESLSTLSGSSEMNNVVKATQIIGFFFEVRYAELGSYIPKDSDDC